MNITMKGGSRAAMLSLAALMLAGMTAAPLQARADSGATPGPVYAAGQSAPTADDSDKGKKPGKGDKGGSEPIIISPPIITKDPPKKKS